LSHLTEIDAKSQNDDTEGFWGIPPDENDKEPVRQEPAVRPVKLDPFWKYVKGNVIYAYFNSEEVGENVLTYDPVPGEAIGCMDMDPSMRVYSL